MRACTATVIRLEYNNANRLYEGEVHFVEKYEETLGFGGPIALPPSFPTFDDKNIALQSSHRNFVKLENR